VTTSLEITIGVVEIVESSFFLILPKAGCEASEELERVQEIVE